MDINRNSPISCNQDMGFFLFKDKTRVARFVSDSVSITDNDTGTIIETLAVPPCTR